METVRDSVQCCIVMYVRIYPYIPGFSSMAPVQSYKSPTHTPTHPKPKKQLSSRNRYQKMLAMPFERNTVECRYNAVQNNMVLHTPLQQVRQNINEKLSPKEIHHISPYYRVYFVNVWEKDDLVIMAPHCTTIK